MEKGDILANRYRLDNQLGHGGFSSVWVAYDIISKVDVALKIYAPDGGLNDEGIEDFREEFRLVFDLNHANILRPYHYGVLNNIPFIVLPYCHNGSCISKKGKFTEDELWKFFYEVASGLSYLHNHPKKIIHQDIKPANILIDNSGHYLITDFGISIKLHHTIRRTVGKHYENSIGAGTIAYMGPERFGEDPNPVMASDIWSLGATVYELVVGETPFGENGGSMQKRALIPKIKENISNDLKELIYACMSVNPWDRPSAADIKKIAEERKFKRTKKCSYKNIMIAASIGVVALICSVLLYHHQRNQRLNEVMYKASVSQGRNYVTISQTYTDENMFDVDSIRNALNLSQENFRKAIEMDIADEVETSQLIKQIETLESIKLYCDEYACLDDTVRMLYEDERLMSAKVYEDKRNQHKFKIINQINSL